jgi:hypothetical protein
MNVPPSQPPRSIAVRLIAVGGLLLAVPIIGAAIALQIHDRASKSPPVESGPELSSGGSLDRQQVAMFCGDCHGMPSPAGFPKEAWHEEVKKGYEFYLDSERTDLTPPDFDQVVAWFRKQAPEEVRIPGPPESPAPDRLQFRRSSIEVADRDLAGSKAAVAFIKYEAPGADAASVLFWCDMQNGELRAWDPRSSPSASRLLGKAAHPAHVEPCDLDGDGRIDLIVAELGSFLPADHADGNVTWMRHTADGWHAEVLQSGLGRVADVQPGDFDGDGDLDLVVAEFGWRKTGRIVFLENLGNKQATPLFGMRVLDPRHGTIHVPAVDLNGDGKLDFVALISQEHETVVAFLNDGAGEFRRETIFSAHEPAFGSSGIQIVDLDTDGDLDVLYTNGDTFDSFYPKPYHSIRWLENRGSFPFQDHLLAVMPGVHRALAGDLDGDGDLDVVACSLLPQRILGTHQRADLDSVVWLEQTDAGHFTRHSLERETCQHAAMEAGDFDADGDIDLAVGNFSDREKLPAVTVWWNLRIDAEHEK